MPNNKVRQGRIYTVFALLFIELLHIILIEKSLSSLLALLLIIYTIQVLITDNFLNSQKNRNIFFVFLAMLYDPYLQLDTTSVDKMYMGSATTLLVLIFSVFCKKDLSSYSNYY